MKIRNMKIKELIDKSKKVGQIINKSCFSVFLDVLRCSKSYGTNYQEYFDLEFYLLNNEERSTYLTSKYNEEIIDKYNNKEISNKLSNKLELYEVYKDYIGRDFINLSEVSFREFKDFIIDKEKIVAKKLYSGEETASVILLDKDKLKNEYNVLKIYNNIIKNEQFIVEEYINQDDNLNKLYSGCVNSLGITTFVSSNNQVNVLNSILRIGKNGNVDNFNYDGIQALINDKGIIGNEGVDKNGEIFEVHPLTGNSIVGFEIPNYDEVIKFVKELALKISDVRYVMWNVIISKKGIMLLSADFYPNVYQMKPSVSKVKTGCMLKYREFMDI